MTGQRAARADARANRSRIIEAARALYAEEGLDVSFNAVAHRAGIGNATLYRHFGGPDELREAVLRTRMQESFDMLTELAGLDDPAAELRRYLAWVFETADLSLIGLAPERSTISPEAMTDAVRVRERLGDLVDRAHHVGVLRQEVGQADVLVAATALVHVARHSEIPARLGESFLETVLRGLGVGD